MYRSCLRIELICYSVLCLPLLATAKPQSATSQPIASKTRLSKTKDAQKKSAKPIKSIRKTSTSSAKVKRLKRLKRRNIWSGSNKRKRRVKGTKSKRQLWPTKRPKKLVGILPNIEPAPYEPGERLVFKVSMFGSDAGNVLLAVGEPVTQNGVEYSTFAGFMRGSEFLNKFYPVENRLVVVANSQTLLPAKTDFYVRENGKAIDYHTEFDHKKRLLDSTKLKKGRKLYRNFTTAQDIHEPLGSVYAVRRMNLKPGDRFQRYIWDGRKERLIDCKVVGFEKVTTQAGEFETLNIEIETKITGGFVKASLHESNQRGTIWIATDRWRTPVKMIAPTKLGNAEAELIRRYVFKEGQEEEMGGGLKPVTPKPN